MGFEVYDKRSAPSSEVPTVTIQKKGMVSFNSAAHEIINGELVVELLFDRDRRVMALRPSKPSPHTYKLRKAASGKQMLLSATGFMRAYGVDVSVSKRYQPFEEEGMLCVDLSSPTAEVHGNRASEDSASKTDAE